MNRYILLISIALISSSSAEEPRKIDFTQFLTGVNGDILFQGGDDCLPQAADKLPLIPGKTCGKTNLTLGDVAVGALESQIDADRNEDPKKRFERDQLARKIYKKADVVLSTEEISTIKDRVGRVHGASVVGAAWPLLDPSLVK
jgi:hypothetical protein